VSTWPVLNADEKGGEGGEEHDCQHLLGRSEKKRGGRRTSFINVWHRFDEEGNKKKRKKRQRQRLVQGRDGKAGTSLNPASRLQDKGRKTEKKGEGRNRHLFFAAIGVHGGRGAVSGRSGKFLKTGKKREGSSVCTMFSRRRGEEGSNNEPLLFGGEREEKEGERGMVSMLAPEKRNMSSLLHLLELPKREKKEGGGRKKGMDTFFL